MKTVALKMKGIGSNLILRQELLSYKSLSKIVHRLKSTCTMKQYIKKLYKLSI